MPNDMQDGWDEDELGLSDDSLDVGSAVGGEGAPASEISNTANVVVGDSNNNALIGGGQNAAAGNAAMDEGNLETDEAGGESENNAWDFEEFDDGSSDAPIVDDRPVEPSPPLPENNFQTNVDNQLTDEPQQTGEKLITTVSEENENEWDFDDDLFNDGDATGATRAEGENKQSEKMGQQTEPVETIHNPFLEPVAHQVDPFVNEASNLANDLNVENNVDNDGWSDDEAFFDNDDDLAPSVTTPLQQHSQQQFQQLTQQLTPPQNQIMSLLQLYLTNLSSPSLLARLHSKLLTKSAATQLVEYYKSRPGLKQYTLGVELDRMDYVLICVNGERIVGKHEIRGFFENGGEGNVEVSPEEVSLEEVLVRSANQSLLADALVLLTSPEEALLDNMHQLNQMHQPNNIHNGNGNNEFTNNETDGMNLILSGPLLCMTSVAEKCQFVLDLKNGLVEARCLLAVSVPYEDGGSSNNANGEYGNGNNGSNGAYGNNGAHGNNAKAETTDGRLILARANVVVRFKPSITDEEESTVQYLVESVQPYPPGEEVLRSAAIALARDQHDPFSQYTQPHDENETTSDVRDLFLLNHHLLSDSHLLAVSDHLVRLKGVAEAKSTGFKSALQQLDGVTGVSGKLERIKHVTSGASGGIGGFLSLPSAKEIEEAEMEGVGVRDEVGRFPRPNDIQHQFPRPNEIQNQHGQQMPMYGRGPPPPPERKSPLPLPPQFAQQQDVSRPRPLIGGMFLSGLSRLAAAATQPDNQAQADNEPPTLYQREEQTNSDYTVPQWDGTTGGTGLTPSFASVEHNASPFASPLLKNNVEKDISPVEEKIEEDVDEMDGGWSDDGLDFEEEDQEEAANNEMVDVGLPSIQDASDQVTFDSSSKVRNITPPSVMDEKPSKPTSATEPESIEPSLKTFPINQTIPPPPQPTAKHHPETISFEDEFVIVLKEKVEQEEKEMRETGQMRRWRPISEDPVRRGRLMQVMVNQLDCS